MKKSFDKVIRGIDGSFDEEVDVAGNVVKQLGFSVTHTREKFAADH